jgi:hypothetical protein
MREERRRWEESIIDFKIEERGEKKMGGVNKRIQDKGERREEDERSQ